MAARRRSWTGDDEAPALLFATDGASAGQRSDLQVCITPSACVREIARLESGIAPLPPMPPNHAYDSVTSLAATLNVGSTAATPAAEWAGLRGFLPVRAGAEQFVQPSQLGVGQGEKGVAALEKSLCRPASWRSLRVVVVAPIVQSAKAPVAQCRSEDAATAPGGAGSSCWIGLGEQLGRGALAPLDDLLGTNCRRRAACRLFKLGVAPARHPQYVPELLLTNLKAAPA